MSIVSSSTIRQPRCNAIVLNGHAIEEVNQFTYLGCEICKDGGSDADVDCTVRQAKGAFGILSPIWGVRWRVGVVDALCHDGDQGNCEEEES